jgi:hypothetical protein
MLEKGGSTNVSLPLRIVRMQELVISVCAPNLPAQQIIAVSAPHPSQPTPAPDSGSFSGGLRHGIGVESTGRPASSSPAASSLAAAMADYVGEFAAGRRHGLGIVPAKDGLRSAGKVREWRGLECRRASEAEGPRSPRIGPWPTGSSLIQPPLIMAGAAVDCRPGLCCPARERPRARVLCERVSVRGSRDVPVCPACACA